MSNEFRIQVSVRVKNGNLDYQSRPTAFNATQSTRGGASPGQVTVTPSGTDIDLSQLSSPGICWIQNLDPTNYVTYGLWDPDVAKFYPLGEILPGEFWALRLSRSLSAEFTGSGTVVLDSNTRLRFKAANANCQVRVDAFER